MTDTTFNPLGTDGFEFVEYSAPDAAGVKKLKELFELLGFTEVAKHKSKEVFLYRQGDINFLVNGESEGYFNEFSQQHGPCACAMAWRVEDAQKAFEYAVEKGAKPFDRDEHSSHPGVYGIGGSVLYFVDKWGKEDNIYDADFDFYEGVEKFPKGMGLHTLDHLTHNVKRGGMDVWATFYENIANFREIRYFDIEGKQTGLFSKAMTGPCNKLRIPINESADDKSQIEEFLKEYNGEGIQHIALATDDIYGTIEKLREGGMDFMDTPDTYYDMIPRRIPEHHEDVDMLRKNRILIDGSLDHEEGILLQIFTNTVIGPIFFEIIQRKGNQGFGEGNFKALFESIELDQQKRGVI
ncbi:4-hydroxyphenylpyruvate dioxygenase [Kangiella sediminilitoris]|uniref:4-hydroxyphenylpyruvate dioxygenase n=1 Tax=Kangiella sediminilitoris TaxID=1144748 RepID=A0A1B3BA85_9GAMM|nr:4-hydroxyphenylpyruvate dioxygenase [Kangiella sediminilitoris]AOE49688.1 4-hydroxyphenylpyruvate dioxygenase [Kangiella sediminilitoris]